MGKKKESAKRVKWTSAAHTSLHLQVNEMLRYCLNGKLARCADEVLGYLWRRFGELESLWVEYVSSDLYLHDSLKHKSSLRHEEGALAKKFERLTDCFLKLYEEKSELCVYIKNKNSFFRKNKHVEVCSLDDAKVAYALDRVRVKSKWVKRRCAPSDSMVLTQKDVFPELSDLAVCLLRWKRLLGYRLTPSEQSRCEDLSIGVSRWTDLDDGYRQMGKKACFLRWMEQYGYLYFVRLFRRMYIDVKQEYAICSELLRAPISFKRLSDHFFDEEQYFSFLNFRCMTSVRLFWLHHRELKGKYYDACGDVMMNVLVLEDCLRHQVWSEDHREILGFVAKGFRPQEIVDELRLRGVDESYVWRSIQRYIPQKIVEAYMNQKEMWMYTYVFKGTYKRCAKCERVLLGTVRYFTYNASSADGLYSVCKKCKSKSGKVI